jgi:hypothetical protein
MYFNKTALLEEENHLGLTVGTLTWEDFIRNFS